MDIINNGSGILSNGNIYYREQIRGIPIERPILSISEGVGYAMLTVNSCASDGDENEKIQGGNI